MLAALLLFARLYLTGGECVFIVEDSWPGLSPRAAGPAAVDDTRTGLACKFLAW